MIYYKLTQTPSMHLVLPSSLLSDVQSDAMSLFFGGDQVHVVGDEELPSTGYRGPPGRDEGCGAEVGGPLVTFQLDERIKTQQSHLSNVGNLLF